MSKSWERWNVMLKMVFRQRRVRTRHGARERSTILLKGYVICFTLSLRLCLEPHARKKGPCAAVHCLHVLGHSIGSGYELFGWRSHKEGRTTRSEHARSIKIPSNEVNASDRVCDVKVIAWFPFVRHDRNLWFLSFPGSLRATFLLQSASVSASYIQMRVLQAADHPLLSRLRVAVSFCSFSWWAVGSADCCSVSSGCTVSFSVVPPEVLIQILTVPETETHVKITSRHKCESWNVLTPVSHFGL